MREGFAAHRLHSVAHRREINDRRNAGEILHQHPRGTVGDLLARRGGRVPRRQSLDVVGRDGRAVLVAQQVLEQDFERIRKTAELVLPDGAEPEDLILAAGGLNRGARAKAVHDADSLIQGRIEARKVTEPAGLSGWSFLPGSNLHHPKPLRPAQAESNVGPKPSVRLEHRSAPQPRRDTIRPATQSD